MWRTVVVCALFFALSLGMVDGAQEAQISAPDGWYDSFRNQYALQEGEYFSLSEDGSEAIALLHYSERGFGGMDRYFHVDSIERLLVPADDPAAEDPLNREVIFATLYDIRPESESGLESAYLDGDQFVVVSHPGSHPHIEPRTNGAMIAYVCTFYTNGDEQLVPELGEIILYVH